MTSHQVLNIHLNNLSDQELDQTILNYLNGTSPKIITTPNPEFLLLARHDKKFTELLNNSDLSLPDGFGLKLAGWLNGFNLHRHTGVDTLEVLIRLAGDKTILFLGNQDSAAVTAEIFRKKYPNLKIKTLDPGQVPGSGEINKQTFFEIKNFSPAILIVGLGQGKQEKFIAKYLSQLPSVRIAIGVGGAFDTVSCKLPRAPLFMRQTGLEWLWRLIIEPKRWRRIFNAILIFPIIVFWDKITKLKL